MEHTNELREVMENIKLSGAIDAKDQFEIDNILKNIEDAVQAGIVKNERLQKQIEGLEEELAFKEDELEDTENTLQAVETDKENLETELEDIKPLVPTTLEDERKLLITRRLMHNLTEEELTKLETFAKSQFKKPGIIYQEVF
jgi:cell division septum initiation protein DivIVA